MLKGPPFLFRISSTPIVRPRETSGAHRIERVSKEVLASTLGEKRGSRAASLTIAGLPLSATQPATPSPILGRSAAASRPLGAERRLEHQLLLLLVDHQQRPGLGGDQLADLLDHQLDHLARLEDRVGGLHDVGQDREPARRRLKRRRARARAAAAGRGARGSRGRARPRAAGPPAARPRRRNRDRARRSAAARARRAAAPARRSGGPAARAVPRRAASASCSPETAKRPAAKRAASCAARSLRAGRGQRTRTRALRSP